MIMGKKIDYEASVQKMRLVFVESKMSKFDTFMTRLILSFSMGMICSGIICGLAGIHPRSLWFLVLGGILTVLWGYRMFIGGRLKQVHATTDLNENMRILSEAAEQLHWQIVLANNRWVVMIMPEEPMLFSGGFELYVIIDTSHERFLYTSGTFGTIGVQSPFHPLGEYSRCKKFKTVIEKITAAGGMNK